MTDAVFMDREGIKNTVGRIITQHVPLYGGSGSRGQRECLGFFGGTGGNPYIHIKTNAGGSSDRMHKFEYDGYSYAAYNIHNSLTFYTYSGTATPYVPSLESWGEAGGGISNYYYSSSDDKVVITINVNGSYTGGFLYHQSGSTHVHHTMDVLAVTQSTSNSAVY